MTTPPAPGDATADTAAPTCYRHAGRETWVSCTRCERPICPDCMRSAAVGFQCPECVATGARTVRQPRTTFGGRLSADTARVTITLLAINIVMYLLQNTVSGLTDRLLLIASAVTFTGDVVGVAHGEYYRLLTAAFLHGSVLHLLFNMYALFLVGPQLEAAFGRVRFVALYLTAALGGSVASYVFSAPNQGGLGASGAVFGLFAAYYVVARRLNIDSRAITTVLAINLVIGFVVPGIDWRAHLGGLVVGGLVAAAGCVLLAWWLRARAWVLRCTEEGYRVRLVRGAGVTSARWAAVEQVVTTYRHDVACLELRLRDGRTTTVPVGVLGVDREELVRHLQERLQEGHGLRPL